MKHNANAYTHGCRCDVCRQAHAERLARYRIRLRTQSIPVEVHGKNATYTNWGCRCDLCNAAHTESWQEWAARTNYQQPSRAKRAAAP